MTSEDPATILEEAHVRETYRYLRIGLIGAAALLGVAVLLERAHTDCWQGSISAYYYTPARGVFVGTLVAIGLVMIVIKGKGLEDLYLNLAGMLAPVVAFIPTTSVGDCWSIEPQPSPLAGRNPTTLADWVVANIENNMWALIITGALGLVLAFGLYMRTRDSFLWPIGVGPANLASVLGMLLVGLIIGGSALALWGWDDFALRAHDGAAIGMFFFLTLASITNALRTEAPGYRRTYWLVAVLMVLSALVVWGLTAIIDDWNHAVFTLEVVEIGLFATYWIAQTAEHWGEQVEVPAGPGAQTPSPG